MPGCTVDPWATAWDADRLIWTVSATFTGKHTTECEGFPPPTNKTLAAHYSYSLFYNDEGKIIKMVKIWNDAFSMKQVGWTD